MNNFIYMIEENASEIFDFPSTDYCELNMLCYTINENAIDPFLLFMVEKKEIIEKKDYEFHFPKLLLNRHEEFNIQDKISEMIGENFIYYGVIKDEQSNYYAIIRIQNHIHQNNYFFALATEIINYKKIYNYKISREITDAFIKNPLFYLLINRNTQYPYKLPDLAYKYINSDEENYYLNFGNKKEKMFESCDEYYFFNKSMNNLLRHVTIIRYAIFTGNKIYYENNNEFTRRW